MAKISDFGFSKFINRNQSRQVMTTMRGTFGYMTPGWAQLSPKRWMYIASGSFFWRSYAEGRISIDLSRKKVGTYWRLFQNCWGQGTLLSIVDRCSEDMQSHGIEVTEMMKVASWCLQTDFTRRPSMSSVVNVLEGVMNVESNLDYNFLWTISMQKITDGYEKRSKPMSASILSGPRWGEVHWGSSGPFLCIFLRLMSSFSSRTIKFQVTNEFSSPMKKWISIFLCFV